MARRITVALVALVALALLVAGGGALLLAGLADRRDARAELEDDSRDLADLVAFVGNQMPRALPAVRRSLELDGAVVVAASDLLNGQAELPDGVVLDTRDIALLRAGETVSEVDGGFVFAAAPVRRPGGQIVVVSRTVPLVPSGVARWFAVASGVALLAAVATGLVTARRLVRPLRALDATTRRIAGGDLGARVDAIDRHDEVAELAASVNAMAEALERGRDLDRNFLLSVSHDLRTPLTSIRGWAEAMRDGATDDPSRAAAIIESETRRLERLVADLLELATLDARHFSLRDDDVDAVEVVTSTVDGFRPAFDDAGLELAVVADATAHLRGDADRLAQIVANLVENALKYAERSVVVTVGPDGDDVVVDVADDGPGIASADVPRVFDRLYASGRPARRQAGTGLGLAIVTELVGAMGGDVRVASTGIDGTTLRVRLPVRT